MPNKNREYNQKSKKQNHSIKESYEERSVGHNPAPKSGSPGPVKGQKSKNRETK